MKSSVTVYEQTIQIPTYAVSPPEKSPLFLETRAYQGSTGKVYPFAVTERIADEKQDMPYQAIFLENEYLKIMILPELGGRIQRAYDKLSGYDFVYYNHVIKPALVGLTGPWISGGIEFNWPQHHRPTTFSPVDYRYTENADGSCSVYVGETDRMYGTKGMARISLYPGKAYVEIEGQLYNPTDLPQTFLWWANPAVPVNDHTFSVFPPDVTAVMDHGKRAVSTFPIATGEYYKYDYSAGVDISRYKNVPVPTSYMAAHSDFDFVGNYDEQVGAGLLHIADHHISPGKKQWTWGNGDFGLRWDRHLTDEDGPYIELMTGVFTDNQPDFTWLKPHEEKTFVQYFMPYKGVGRVGNATKEAVVGMNLEGDACFRIYTSGVYEQAVVTVSCGEDLLYERTVDLTPQACFIDHFAAPADPYACRLTLSYGGKTLVSCRYDRPKEVEIPTPAEALGAPETLATTEELYLAGQHLEQYRHATRAPEVYYLEGLRRDPTDLRLNNAYGQWLLRRGNAAQSIPYFRAAIQKQTWKNPNPYQGECYFNLGLALEWTDDLQGALDAFYKATWSAETQSSGFYKLACLSARNGTWEEALDFVQKALVHNGHCMKSRTLQAFLLRRLTWENASSLAESGAIDPLDLGILYEQSLQGDSSFSSVMRGAVSNYLDLALRYLEFGGLEEADAILAACPEAHPLRDYYRCYVAHCAGDLAAARLHLQQAEAMPVDYCFPNKLEEQRILMTCLSLQMHAPKAHYALGNLLYDKKQIPEAIAHWETAAMQDSSLAMAWRNLSIAYCNKEQNLSKAWSAIQTACQLEPTYPRFLLERDQLAARKGMEVSSRLADLQANAALLAERDDLYLRHLTLLNCNGDYAQALDALNTHQFHPWEGGEGKVSAQYRFALLQLAKQALRNHAPNEAIGYLTRSLEYPDCLGEGKLPNVPDHAAYYHLGLAHRLLGEEEQATAFFERATRGEQEPAAVLYYNDQPSDFIFYQGLSLQALGQQASSEAAFLRLIDYATTHLHDRVSYDFFAVSLPEIDVYQEPLSLRNEQYCRYLMALGLLGLGEMAQAKALFTTILSFQPDHQGALEHLPLCEKE